MKRPTDYQITQGCCAFAAVLFIGSAIGTDRPWLARIDGIAGGFMVGSVFWNIQLKKAHDLLRDITKHTREMADLNQALIHGRVMMHFEGEPDDQRPVLH